MIYQKTLVFLAFDLYHILDTFYELPCYILKGVSKEIYYL